MKVISLVGARPQFIKEAVIQKEWRKHRIQEVLVHSGQHYGKEMSDTFFRSLNISKTHYNLHVGSGTHAEMTGKIMIGFEKIVGMEKPDVVIVFGDTNTTLAGALVSRKLKIKVAHIEAGVRTNTTDMPEEINRIIVDRISSFLFCPSKLALENLKKEGVGDHAYFVGDTMLDLFLKTQRHFSYSEFEKNLLEENNFILATIHRDYNVDNPDVLKKILESLLKINKRKKIVFSIHPRTKKRIREFSFEKYLKHIIVIPPLDYLSAMGLLKKAEFVITDSGGFQKEAYYARKRAFILMPDTGWKELIYNGWNVLCNSDNIYDALFDSQNTKYIPNIYGDGWASKKIVEILLDNLRI